MAAKSEDHGPIGDPDEASIGTPMGTPVPDARAELSAAKDAKIESMKGRSKVLSAASGLALMAVAGPAFWFGVNASCDALLVRMVMGWLFFFGILLLLAEIGVELVRKNVHVLAYRTGRATVAFFAATVCLAAAPSEVAIAGLGPGHSSSLVTQVDWQFAGVGFLLGASACYMVKVSCKAAARKLGGKAPATSGGSTEMM
mmetsp:Transcript_9417/g.24126  ORF Transcript_9417/g.24126 Transcript_9417/m.24126 type:complete len:200 (+) Transcript_9417:16-615(+)